MHREESDAWDAFQRSAEQKRGERQQPAEQKQGEWHPDRSTNSGCIKLDKEFLQLIKLRDERLAKNARVEYINGKKYEWSAGTVAAQRRSSLSSTFAPTPNY